MSRRADLLIVGAGIQGATAAYEAASRGLSVLLVDRADFGAGCSANSMKIAHGGLRYLQSLNFRRSLESVRERRRLLQLAPRWVRPLRCRLDVEAESPMYRLALRSGLFLNELLSLHRNHGVAESQHLPHAAFPGWYDALIEDTERVLLGFIHGARAANPGGVEVVNYAGVQELIRRGDKVVGARIDGLGEVEAGCVMSCVGATRPGAHVTVSMNLLVDRLPISADECAVGFRHPDDGRNIFVVPWRGRSIIGTHNRSYPYHAADPLRVQPDWIDDFLSWIRPVHPKLAEIRRSDVRFVHAGLLPADASGSDQPLERWKIEQRSDGEIVVQGVKWTTAYGLSVRAVERAASLLGRPEREATRRGKPAALPDSGKWLEEYLTESPDLRAPLLPGRSELTRGEVLFAVEREWARGLGDVLLRRTGIASAGHPGGALVEAVAALMQQTLGWSDTERRREVEEFHEDFHFAGNIPAD